MHLIYIPLCAGENAFLKILSILHLHKVIIDSFFCFILFSNQHYIVKI